MNNSTKNIQEFLNPLKETHFSLKDYVDFNKIVNNVDEIAIKLNQLNYLIGKEDLSLAVNKLWDENPQVFSIMGILIAIRPNDNKKVIDEQGDIKLISDYFTSPNDVIDFIYQTGLAKIFQNREIKNLVDYVFGIEVGLDTNARKNRGGHIMENIISNIFEKNDIIYKKEIYHTNFPELIPILGADKKRFDFTIEKDGITYLIETNFYTSGGSKLNEVARSYSELASKIDVLKKYKFVWITDGIGWFAAKNKLEESFHKITHVYNLTTINDFINFIKK